MKIDFTKFSAPAKEEPLPAGEYEVTVKKFALRGRDKSLAPLASIEMGKGAFADISFTDNASGKSGRVSVFFDPKQASNLGWKFITAFMTATGSMQDQEAAIGKKVGLELAVSEYNGAVKNELRGAWEIEQDSDDADGLAIYAEAAASSASATQDYEEIPF